MILLEKLVKVIEKSTNVLVHNGNLKVITK